jgi:hypothetical protein
MSQPARNDLCPCGSGKRYKHCHGSYIPTSGFNFSSEIRQAVETLGKAAEAVIKEFGEAMDRQPAPPMIYHYTDYKGLRGIIEGGKIWLSDVFRLNDPKELKHGLEIGAGLLEVEAQHRGSDLRTQFAKAVLAKLSAILQGNEEWHHVLSSQIGFGLSHRDFPVSCFSLDGNDLGQWRAYADDGTGYALGFDGHLLEQAFITGSASTSTTSPMTFRVTYSDDCLRTLQTDIVTKIMEIVNIITAPRARMSLDDETTEDYKERLANNLVTELMRSSMFFKHRAYQNEKEYRFLFVNHGGPLTNLKYRERPHTLIRYKEFDWRGPAAHSLREIIVGPAANRALALPFARDCLRAYHPAIVPVKASDIPYRAS